MCANLTELKKSVADLENAGIDLIHLDIMDGHFVPNISFGPDVVKQLRPKTDVPFDVHLMISHPLKYLDRFVEGGADVICFHIECEDDTQEVINAIKARGVKPALAIKPGTPVEALYPYADELFMALVMTVEPGFGGQSFMDSALPKLKAISEEAAKRGLNDLYIEVDGGINGTTGKLCADAGANLLVAGSYVFGAQDVAAAIESLKI